MIHIHTSSVGHVQIIFPVSYGGGGVGRLGCSGGHAHFPAVFCHELVDALSLLVWRGRVFVGRGLLGTGFLLLPLEAGFRGIGLVLRGFSLQRFPANRVGCRLSRGLRRALELWPAVGD